MSAAVQEALEDFGRDLANDQTGGGQFVTMTAYTLIEKTGARVVWAIKTSGRWVHYRPHDVFSAS